MPSQRLRRIIKDLEVPVASSTRGVDDHDYDDSRTKISLRNHTTMSSSTLLKAVEYRTMKKRKSMQEQHPSKTVRLEKTKQSNDNDYNADGCNNTAANSNDIHHRNDNSNSSNTNDIVRSIHELRKVYLYGLQTVSKLQDLRDAPDAILPGNFCDTKRIDK